MPPLTAFGVNSYIIVNEKNEGVLIDAPESEAIMKKLITEGIELKKILLTHGHCDHIAGCAALERETGAEVYIHSADEKKLLGSNGNLATYFGLPPIDAPDNVKTVEDGQIITQGELEFEVFHTPGHTSGCVCYILGDEMFCGDTLFKNSMGRTDMPDGDEAVIMESLAMLYDFDVQTDYKLYSGHGESSSMSAERRNNPYMKYAHKLISEKGNENV